jgi:hypothetical protein
VGLCVLLALGAGAFLYAWPLRHGQDVARPAPPVASQAALVPSAPEPAKPAAPAFDIVRVTPEGSTIIAGRAQPGAEVVVREGEREFGKARADRRGEFVMVPDAKLQPGGRELTLSARPHNGGPEITSGESVIIVVPPPPDAGTARTAVAVLVPKDTAPTRILQPPRAADRSSRLALETVDYDENGEIRFSGSAKPSTALRVYVDNQPVGDATADANGRWTLSPRRPVAQGVHQFRVDQLAQTGKVVSRVELPFQRQAAPPAEIGEGRVLVQPGQNLWRIARQAYGSGVRYTVIYLANREQIRDPKLIYPGQIFSTPAQ